MIKHTKYPLLKKPKPNSTQPNYPFEFQQSYSEFANKPDQPYYLLDENKKANPYLMELTEQKVKPNKQKQFIPETVTMNGNHYQRVDNCKVDQNEVKAQCMACNTQQMIPKNSKKFYCFECKTLCICQQPQENESKESVRNVKFFICGCCSVKVKYLAGTSQFIRCSKCQTTNHVPK